MLGASLERNAGSEQLSKRVRLPSSGGRLLPLQRVRLVLQPLALRAVQAARRRRCSTSLLFLSSLFAFAVARRRAVDVKLLILICRLILISFILI